MKPIFKVIISAALSLMLTVTSIGYAQYSTALQVNGQAEITPPEQIYITNVGTHSTSIGANGTVTVNDAPVNIDYPSTLVYSDMTFVKNYTSRRTAVSHSVTVTVTLFNNTDYTYIFNQLVESGTDNSAFSYSNYVECTVDMEQGTKIEAGAKIDVEMTYTYRISSTRNSNTSNHISLYEFDFVLDESDLSDKISKGALEKFKQILNDSTDYATLVDALQAHAAGNYRSYIGNVEGDEDGSDSQLLETLFDGELVLTIGDTDVYVTTIVKRQDMDGNENTGLSYEYDSNTIKDGCEMILYLTAEDLSNRAGQDADVYAAVFTVEQDADGDPTGEWYQVGDLYLGRAQIVAYEGVAGAGSFWTENWTSKEDATYGQSLDTIIKNLN